MELFALSPDQPSKLKETSEKHQIGFRYFNPDYRVRLSPDLLLAAARILFK